MRIGLVSYEYPPQQGLGGVGSYMFRLANALGQAGHEVHVLAGPSNYPAVRQPNVQLHRIPAHYELDSSNPAFRWLYWRGFARTMNWLHPAIWHWIKWDLASFDALCDLHRAQPLDLIEVPEHAANGMMAGKIHRWPIVMRMHCPWDLFVRINRFGFNPMHRVLSHLEKQTAARAADGITVPSEAMRRELVRSWRLPRQPIVVPNFMDVPDEASPLPADLDSAPIVCVGRVEPLKGQDVLVRAFAKMAAKHPSSRLFIVGPDRWPGKHGFAELLPRLVPDPEIRRRIDLYGAIPLHEVPALLRSARLVIVPSRGFESFSFAVLEAMAAARPVIASNVGAMPELVEDGQTGLVVASENAEALASAMAHLLSDSAAAQKMAVQGHAKARQVYHTPLVVPRIMAAYEDASDYFYQVRAAGGPATAGQWRRAIAAGRS